MPQRVPCPSRPNHHHLYFAVVRRVFVAIIASKYHSTILIQNQQTLLQIWKSANQRYAAAQDEGGPDKSVPHLDNGIRQALVQVPEALHGSGCNQILAHVLHALELGVVRLHKLIIELQAGQSMHGSGCGSSPSAAYLTSLHWHTLCQKPTGLWPEKESLYLCSDPMDFSSPQEDVEVIKAAGAKQMQG